MGRLYGLGVWVACGFGVFLGLGMLAFVTVAAPNGEVLGVSALLADSLVGVDAQGFWWLSRASGLVAYVLFGVAMVLGLLMSSKTTRLWSHGPAFFAMHEFCSVLAWVFALVHGLVLLGDGYLKVGLGALLVPFGVQVASNPLQVFWVGLGQLGFWLFGAVVLSFYVRQRIGHGVWRWLHWATFLAFMLVSVHGLLAGSDTRTGWVLGGYALCQACVVFLSAYRVLLMRFESR